MVSKIVTPLPASTSWPVDPKANVLTPVPLLENSPVVKILLLMFNVPAVKVVVLVEPLVKLSCSWNVLPAPLNVKGKSNVTPLLVIDLVPLVPAKVVADVPAVYVPPEAGIVRPP